MSARVASSRRRFADVVADSLSAPAPLC